jgi:hypothetical protein
MKSILILLLVSIYVDGASNDKLEKKIEKILEKQDILKESIKKLKVGIHSGIKSIPNVTTKFLFLEIREKTGCQN